MDIRNYLAACISTPWAGIPPNHLVLREAPLKIEQNALERSARFVLILIPFNLTMVLYRGDRGDRGDQGVRDDRGDRGDWGDQG